MIRPQAAFSKIGPHNGGWRPLHCWKWYLEDEEGNESNLDIIMSKIAICFLSFNHCSIYFRELSILEIPSIAVAVYFFWTPFYGRPKHAIYELTSLQVVMVCQHRLRNMEMVQEMVQALGPKPR